MLLAQQTDVPDARLVSCTATTTTVVLLLFSAHMCWYYTILPLFGTYGLVLHSSITSIFIWAAGTQYYYCGFRHICACAT